MASDSLSMTPPPTQNNESSQDKNLDYMDFFNTSQKAEINQNLKEGMF